MAEERFEPRTCKLNLALYRYGGIKTSYDAKMGLRRSFGLPGFIRDPYISPIGDIDESGEGNSAFHYKDVRVTISSPPDPDWLEKIRAAHGVDDACGAVLVNAGVEPDRFELDGESVEDEPVHVTVTMSADAFEAIRRQVAEASDHRRIMWATVTLAGNSLPKLESDFIRLKDLDVTERRGYAVSGFEIFDTRYIDRLRGRVLRVERGRDKGYGARISILLTEARYEIDVERALVRAISCEGRVINAKGRPYDGAEVTIEFSEHEPNRYDEMPERAFFGEFGYFPKQPGEYSSTHFMFDLRYVPEDARGLLIPLLSQQVETRVILTVNLANKEGELLAATGELRGNVRDYGFKGQRRLVRAPEADLAGDPGDFLRPVADRADVERMLLELSEDERIRPERKLELRDYLNQCQGGRLDPDDERYVRALYKRMKGGHGT